MLWALPDKGPLFGGFPWRPQIDVDIITREWGSVLPRSCAILTLQTLFFCSARAPKTRDAMTRITCPCGRELSIQFWGVLDVHQSAGGSGEDYFENQTRLSESVTNGACGPVVSSCLEHFPQSGLTLSHSRVVPTCIPCLCSICLAGPRRS